MAPANTFTLTVEVSGLVFYLATDEPTDPFYGLYALLLDPSKAEHAGHTGHVHEPHLSRMFVWDVNGPVGGSPGIGYQTFELHDSIRWPDNVELQPRPQVPNLVTDLEKIGKFKFKREHLETGSGISAIIPLNFGSHKSYLSPVQFRYVHGPEKEDCNIAKEVRLAWKHEFSAEVEGTELPLSFANGPTQPLKPDQKNEIRLIINSRPEEYSYPQDPEADAGKELENHFPAYYDFLKPAATRKCYPDPIATVGPMYTCMPGGGG
jgi:hypothetical protein